MNDGIMELLNGVFLAQVAMGIFILFMISVVIFLYCSYEPLKHEVVELRTEVAKRKKNAFAKALCYGWKAQIRFLLDENIEIIVPINGDVWRIVGVPDMSKHTRLRLEYITDEGAVAGKWLNDAVEENLVNEIEIRAIVANLMKQVEKDL